jgi:tRNA modification GTPase
MDDAPDYTRDTIAAVATPPGRGGIGIVRISGPDSQSIATRLLGRLPRPRYATMADFRDAAGEVIDSGVALWFPAPDSFTGESVLELQGHGGPAVMSMLVDAALRFGARRARPGEFSQRAFLNGKLDLVQAEAVADLIDSGTDQAARAAQRSLSGAFSTALDDLAEQLIQLRLHVEAAIDFPEEEIDFLSDAALIDRIARCERAFDDLTTRAKVGRLLRDGFRVAIVGRPNAGKSSLLNQLSGQEAAIVTEVAGTTRDILRERIDIDGLAVELVDTAGLRDDPDTIEAEGIRRARSALADADAVIWVRDVTAPDDDDLRQDMPAGKPVIILFNKIDLSGDPPGEQSGETGVLNVSAKTGAGVEALRQTIRRIAGFADLGEGAFTARQRHVDALLEAREHFAAGCDALRTSRAGELLAEELRLAQESLGGITGAISSDDLLGRIFAEFCIGK